MQNPEYSLGPEQLKEQESFLYRSIILAEAINSDPSLLSDQLPKDPEPGYKSSRVFTPIGGIFIGDEPFYAGIKTGKDELSVGITEQLFADEMEDMMIIKSIAPELTSKLPGFMCLIKDSEGLPVGTLVEDASLEGLAEVEPMPVSEETERLLRDSLRSGLKLDEQVMKAGIAFNAGGVERFLDLNPSLFSNPRGNTSIIKRYESQVERIIPELTITIPSESQLAQSVLRISRASL